MCIQGGIRCNNYYSVFCIEKTPYSILDIPYYFAVHMHVLALHHIQLASFYTIVHNCTVLGSFQIDVADV